MKVVFVVDSLNDLNKKIAMLQSHFGNDIIYIVKANLAKIFKTYGHFESAVYYNNLSKIIHYTLLKLDVSSLVICYASLEFDSKLLERFIEQIKDGQKVVNVMPNYNILEQFSNVVYNLYVKAIFKNEDSLASPKLQYLPQACVQELLQSHLGNKMFAMPSNLTNTMYVEDKKINSSLKIKTGFNKFSLLPIIITLIITACLIMSLAFWGLNFFTIFIFVLLYILDIFLSIVFSCKNYFDNRFLK